MKIGILALQGAVREHAAAIKKCGVEVVAVKSAADLSQLDGLVLPGGESTAMRRLIDAHGLLMPLKKFAACDRPIFGTCAGLILLARSISGSENTHLGIMNIVVERNSFGRQINSFEAPLNIKDIGRNFPGVFIRAPHIVEAGEGVDVMCEHEGKIVMVRQNHLLACAFHPELTADQRVISYFVKMVREAASARAKLQ